MINLEILRADVARDKSIMAMRAAGRKYHQIAKAHNLTIGQVAGIIKRRRDAAARRKAVLEHMAAAAARGEGGK